MTDLTPLQRHTDITAVPTEQLRQELMQAIGITARTLGYLAQVWAELERRGEDLSDLRSGLMVYLPLIAEGRLDPELVVRCAGQAGLLKAAAEVPLEEQRRMLEHGVALLEAGDDGSVAEVLRPVERLTAPEVRRVFAGSTIRRPAEQAKLIAPEPVKKRAARAVIVKVRLSKAEYERLRKAAVAKGQQANTLARDIILGAVE